LLRFERVTKGSNLMGQSRLKIAEVLEVATALGIGIDLTAHNPLLKLDSKAAGSTDKWAYTALAPILRALCQQCCSVENSEKGIAAIELKFENLLVQQLKGGRGRPSNFKQMCDSLEVTGDDAKWILHICLVTLIQGVIAKYSEYLAASGDSGEAADDDDDSTGPRINSAMTDAFYAALKSSATSISPERLEDQSKDDAQLSADIANWERWQSLQSASQAVWENFVLAYSLDRDRTESSRMVEQALQDTSDSRARRRREANSKVKGAALKLTQQMATANGGELDLDESAHIRVQIEFTAVLVDLTIESLAPLQVPEYVPKSAPKPVPLALSEMRPETGKRRHDVRRIVPSKELIRTLSRISKVVRAVDPAAPYLTKPEPWVISDGKAKGGIPTAGTRFRPLQFYKFRAKNKRIREFLHHMNRRPECYEEIFAAVNSLQQTGWRVNKRVWDVMRKVIKASGDEDVLDTKLHELFDDFVLPTSIDSKWKPWLQEVFFARHRTDNSGSTKDLKAPGWRMVSPTGALEVMRLAKASNFYFAYNVDSRGRIYPQGTYLQPQGEDTFRALLEFSEGKAITKGGVHWLALHGSQCAAREVVLEDLHILDRELPTIEERIQWVELKELDILASAEDPIEHTWWRTAGGKTPFQFLAFCFAWSDIHEGGPTATCNLPIHVDGTSNGLQHIAALTGDANLAKAVNLFDNEPQDVYLEIAREVQTAVADKKRSVANIKGSREARFETALAKHEKKLRTLLNEHPHLINRDAAKKVVMIIPYGAGAGTYAQELEGFIAEYGKNQPSLEFNELVSKYGQDAAAEVDAYYEKKAEKVERLRMEKGGEARSIFEKGSTDNKWKAPYYGRRMLATLLAREFEYAINKKFPVIKTFKASLQGIASAFAERGVPVAWLTPIGFPVLQNGFRDDVEFIDIRGFSRIRMSHFVIKEEINKGRQIRGILPNLIHSLDSAHLVKTISHSREAGVKSFSMVHDSFGTHAADMNKLTKELRVAFQDIYKDDVLLDFDKWATEALGKVDSVLGGKPQIPEPADPKQEIYKMLQSWAFESRASQPVPVDESTGKNADIESNAMQPIEDTQCTDTSDEKALAKSGKPRISAQPRNPKFEIDQVKKSKYFFY